MFRKEILAIFAVVMLVGHCPIRAVTHWENGHYEVVDGDYFDEILMHRDSTADIWGGQVDEMVTFQNSILNMFGGTISGLFTEDDSTINIYGGTLGHLASAGFSSVYLYAYDVIHTTTGGRWNDGQVMGKYYADDSDFLFDLKYQDTYSHITVVPEPTTLLLLSLGGLMIRQKRYSRFSKSCLWRN